MPEQSINDLLCFVIPAYNEEACIEEVINDWLRALRPLAGERVIPAFKIVVVNDGSKDGTGRILDELAPKIPELVVAHKPNGGHGSAVYEGYRKALEQNPAWVFQVDSDNQFVADDFRLLWDRRAESMFILGSRRSRHDPLHRLVITRILKLFNFLVFGTAISDANIPFRLIQGPYLRALLANIPGNMFAPNIFLAILAASEGQKLLGIPVRHLNRMTGTVSIVRWGLIKACFRCVRELITFRIDLGRARQAIRVARTA